MGLSIDARSHSSARGDGENSGNSGVSMGGIVVYLVRASLVGRDKRCRG